MAANPWQFVGYIPQGPQGETGEKGDRYLVYGVRDEVAQTLTLYRQLQEWDGAAYQAVGSAEMMGVVNDGQVQVGFYLPYMQDNGDSTITFFRQYYCRRDSNSNIFDPQGDPETMGTVALAIGPQGHRGGHYLITSTNPDPNQYNAYFWREYQQWNAQTQQFDPTGVVEQFGGVVGTPGPRGEKGMYYKITTQNPDASTIEFYRRLYDPILMVDYGDTELIGSAVAVQGPPGPAGAVGPPGPGQITIVNDFGLPRNGEWLSWSYFARFLIDLTAAYYSVIHNDYLEGIRAVAGSLGGNLAPPPTDVLIDIPNADAAYMGGLTAEATKDAAARQLYCWFVANQELTFTQLAAKAAEYSDPYSSYWRIPGQEITLLLSTIFVYYGANSANAERFKEGARIARAYAGSENGQGQVADYSGEPCTPAYADWNHVWDFTTGQHSWLSPDGSATYTANTGWVRNTTSMKVDFTFPASVNLTQIEVIWTDLQQHNSSRELFIFMDGSEITAAQPANTLQYILSHFGNVVGSLLRVQANNWSAGLKLVRVSVAGLGTKPPGLT